MYVSGTAEKGNWTTCGRWGRNGLAAN